ncbi:MAG: orotate phosphoribosyltransferase [Candidatus Omnitrophica bacterium]|nr:orotate phosphoribosyltransferase [Candidatus Omnitrophota bacterium]MCM8803581.1 orotate phosphoribosyltransferase [Candidatus Omnitrophota bacterium]
MERIKEKLKNILLKKAVFLKEVVLSSGKKSNFYIDCRIVTLSPEGLYLVSKIIFEMIKNENIDAIGGLTLGADPIVSGVCLISYIEKNPINGFIVRNVKKEHGLEKIIEGNLKENWNVVIVDDVATTGSSILKAIEVVENYKCKVKKVICIVDREEGAKEEIEKKGYKLETIFKKSDLISL